MLFLRSDYIDRVYGVEMNRIIINLEGYVVNAQNKEEKIGDARVVIRNKTYGDSIVTKTDSTGRFTAPLSLECDFEVATDKEGFTPVANTNVSTKGLTESQTLTTQLELVPGKMMKRAGDATFIVRVQDCETNQPIKGLNLVI